MADDRAGTKEIEDKILTFVREELLPPDVAIDRHDDLLSDLIDSVAVLRLAFWVDEEFAITTQPRDFVVENFENAAVLARYVQRVRDAET